MQVWTQADQVRKVKFFLRSELECLRLVRLGVIHPPDYIDTPRERANMLSYWQKKVMELRAALMQEVAKL